MQEIALKNIAKEIEEKYSCKVIYIRLTQLLSLCVDVKLQFHEDFVYKPFEDMPIPYSICFSERTVSFYKRVDLFDCMKNNNLN